MLKKFLLLVTIGLAICFSMDAQVTTSGIIGTVKGADGTGLQGASIKATHTPSGSVYTTTATNSGTFNIQGMRPGGPYTIEISFVGFPTRTLQDISLTLGESYVINEKLSPTGTELSEVVITGTASTSKLNRFKTGASTNISTKEINSLPTISRSITDFTRLTPQANGNSFGGRDGRYNNVQVDGANFNNGFGLSDDPLPGGGGLSIDAIEEIQVNIAPYDVRQGGFTGAGINAITRSGTNKLQGSVYNFIKNQDLQGEKVNGDKLSGIQQSSVKTYGARLGGPIIKNKLFFFVSAEKISSTGPSAGAVNLWKASDNGIADPNNNITRVKRSDLDAVSNHLKNQWGYDPGAYEGYANGESKVSSLLGRIDWNISNKHKLAVRYNRTTNDVPSLTNGTSGANPRASNTYSRVSQNAMSFENSMYFTSNNVSSYTLELNSRFNNRLSNQFLATYSKIQTGRSSPSAEFPFIDIGDGLGTSSVWQNYISAGYELFTYNNAVINDNYTIVNNLTYTAGRHSLLLGASFESQKFANNYMRNGTSYYRYKSVADFLTTGTPGEVAPIQFALTYPYEGADPFAIVKYNLPAVYLQDNISVNDRFNLTLGLRAEIPTFAKNLIANTVVDNLDLLNTSGGVTNYPSGEWPKTRVMLSPRIGFRWDLEGNKSLIIRGGTGIFAGRVPFVWMTNQPSNIGTLQNTIEPGSYAASAAWINDIRFNPDKLYWFNNTPASAANVFIKSPGNGVPGTLALVDPNFKMPQVFRTNIGFDKKIGKSPFTFTVDAMYTKDLQAVYQFGANRLAASQKMYDGRDYYPNSASYTFNSLLGGNSGSVLSNTTMGHSFNLTAGINMTPRNGFFGSLAYSYTFANTSTDNSGSNASSAWGATPNRSNPNDIFLASSADALPHRIVGVFSYRKEYLKHLASTISVYYNGANRYRYSFTYNGDVNGDAISGDLLYIPKDASEVNFVASGGFTVDQQRTAFNELLKNSKYLDKHRGSLAERNGVLMPWLHRFDVKFLQDIFAQFGKQKHTLQLSLDIVNFGNMLNSNWGIQKTLINNASTPLSVVTKGINPTFKMNTASIDGQVVLPTEMYQDVRTFGTTWSMQIGIRYLFN